MKELEHFMQSEMFQLFTVVPITELRVKSYINNPHSQPGDVVLYLGFIENQLVAFRTLYAGCINSEIEKTRFAWCSGNWVHPDFRRKGFSEQLLNEALIDWDGKLMFTNYAPNSEKLYLKSGKFQPIHQFHGFRGYLFPKTRKLIPSANRNRITKFLFSIIDFVIYFISSIRLTFFSTRQNADVRFETIPFPDEMCYKINQNNISKYLFKREEKDFNWIFRFPWITDDASYKSVKYPFSSYSDAFTYSTVKIFIQNELAGFFVFSIRAGNLKTLHFCLPNVIEKEIAIYLKQLCIKYKIEVLTVYNFEVSKQLFDQKFPFLHAKKYGQKIYSSFEIKEIGNYLFQDGDGDVIFT